jgi:hypothetical protein
MRHLLATLLVSLLVIFPSCKYFKGGLFGKKSQSLVEMMARQDSILAADSIRKAQERLLSLESAKLESAKQADVEQLTLENKFNIIVGSFITPDYAKGFSELYRNQGFETRIIKMEGSQFELVSTESFKSYKEAFVRLKEFQNSTGHDAWIYIKN